MKFTSTVLAVASLASAALAQNMTMGNSSDYLSGVAAALESANLTTLATVLGAFPDLAAGLQQGNFTVFAPDNAAFASFLGNNSLSDVNQTEVARVLQYHIAPGTYPQSALTTGENHTIVPSLLQEPLLGNNMTAPLVLSFGVDGKPRIRLVDANVTVGGNATYQNLLVHVIDQVLSVPGNLTATVGAAGLTALGGALGAVSPDLPAMLEQTPRLTVFAPVNEAFSSIQDTIATLNTSTILTVLQNHLINGTVVYSTEITANTTAVSAAGETISFEIMDGQVMVVSGGQAKAKVVRTDIPIENGVVHLIDAVLANPASNPEAAASAASSYAAEASTAMPSMGPIGGAAAATAAPTAGNTNAASKNMLIAGSTLLAAVCGVAVVAL